ncbi:MAG: siphovirus Gp157 family protein [Methylocella sp.]
MNRDPRFALSQELEAKQLLLDQLRALVAEDPDFLTDLIEVETDLLELIAALEASILDDEALVDGAKAALDKLQARKRALETRIEFRRRLLAHALQQIGLKILRTPTSTLSIAEASLKAIAVAAEDIPAARWWKPQPPKLDQDGLTKAVRVRDKAFKEAEALTDPEERRRALAAVETMHPLVPGVTVSNGGIILFWIASTAISGAGPVTLGGDQRYHSRTIEPSRIKRIRDPAS